MKKKLCIILGFILVALFSNEKIQAQESKPGILPDTLQVSLLTCGPGTEVYELFGHTALRVKQQRPGGFDYVFNYGMFNFDVPGFIWRFTKGETDYCLGINDFPDFLLNYQFRESKVDEQVLNLTPIQSRASVSYTHLTLPTNREVEISVVAVTIKKKKYNKKKKQIKKKKTK